MIITNMLLEFTNKSHDIERILYIDSENKILSTINVVDENALPMWRKMAEIEYGIEKGEIIILERDPWLARPVNASNLTKAELKARDWAWKAIKPIIEAEPIDYLDRNRRGRLVNEIVQKDIATKPTIYRLLKLYWKGGQTINALVPKFRNSGAKGVSRTATSESSAKRGRPSKSAIASGRPAGLNVDEKTLGIILKIGREFYKERPTSSLIKAYKDGIKVYYKDGYDISSDGLKIPVLKNKDDIPTYRQFEYHYRKSIDRDDLLESRLGRRRFNLSHRPMIGDSSGLAYGPGSMFQVDAATGDVSLLSSLNPDIIIGKPVIYVIIDTFSRMVVGFDVGLEGPSWMGAIMAFENVVRNKVEFCKELGIEILESNWPTHHLPEAILADRGEFESGSADALVEHFGIRVANTPPYRADWKGIVERHFRLTNEKVIRHLPGAVRLKERGEKDYRLESTLTLESLRKILALCFLEYNQTHIMKRYRRTKDMKEAGIIMTPLAVWNWGIHNRTGGLRSFPHEVVRQALFPTADATMTPRGLKYKNYYYTCDYIESNNWRSKARDKTWRETISYDPWNSGRLWLRLEGQRNFVECKEIGDASSSGNLPWAELEAEAVAHDLATATATPSLEQLSAYYQARIDEEVASAKETVPNVKISKAAKLKNVRENREAEKQHEREQRAKAHKASPEDAKSDHPISSSPINIPLFDQSIDDSLDDLLDGENGEEE